MASRRNLKETVHTDVEEVFFDLSILHTVASEKRKSAIKGLTSKVIDSENDFITRISHADGRSEAKLVHKYYSRLQGEYLHFASEIEGEVNKLGDELLTPEAQSADETSTSHTALV